MFIVARKEVSEMITFRYFYAPAIAFALVGCTSEVDKCVDTEVKAWEAKNERERLYWKGREKPDFSKYGTLVSPTSGDDKSQCSKSEVMAEARKLCLILSRK